MNFRKGFSVQVEQPPLSPSQESDQGSSVRVRIRPCPLRRGHGAGHLDHPGYNVSMVQCLTNPPRCRQTATTTALGGLVQLHGHMRLHASTRVLSAQNHNCGSTRPKLDARRCTGCHCASMRGAFTRGNDHCGAAGRSVDVTAVLLATRPCLRRYVDAVPPIVVR
jgi:hypothetical protein